MTAYGINPPFDGLSRGMGQVGYALLTRAPVVILEEQALPDVTPRLACVKPVASVHPEPGSNSPLYNIFIMTFPEGKFVLSLFRMPPKIIRYHLQKLIGFVLPRTPLSMTPIL